VAAHRADNLKVADSSPITAKFMSMIDPTSIKRIDTIRTQNITINGLLEQIPNEMMA
jgi:hypothetical protein